jgi:hypothetical protein
MNRNPIRQFSSIIALLLLLFTVAANAQQSRRFNKYEDVSGYINITEVVGAMALGTSSIKYSGNFAGITTMNGYVINHHFLTGLGLGAYVYVDGVLVPVYFDIRYTFNNRKYSPFVYGDGGILLDTGDNMSTGLFINPGIGVKRKLSYKTALSVSGGLYLQQFNARASFVNVKVGLYFAGNGGDPCIRK